MSERQERGPSRRDFLLQGTAVTAALAVGPRLVRAAPEGPSVVIVRDKTKKVIEGYQVDAALCQRLVDQAVMAVAGKDDVAKAWATFVQPKDRVAVKFNGLFGRATTHPEVIHAVTAGLIKAGVNPAHITVYDRHDKDMKTTGLTINREGEAVRIRGTQDDLGPEVEAGSVRTRLSKILTEADVLINVPMMKSHVRCAITGALKNHLGTVPNAGAFHNEFCAAIADLNALPEIKEKTRLCIADALYVVYDRGPTFNPRARWDYHGVLASVDPVALDATFDDLILAKRVEKGLKPRSNDPRHIARAAELGLGEADLKKIRRTEMEI
jgi:uncharacterized protein (DUF362 family)